MTYRLHWEELFNKQKEFEMSCNCSRPDRDCFKCRNGINFIQVKFPKDYKPPELFCYDEETMKNINENLSGTATTEIPNTSLSTASYIKDENCLVTSEIITKEYDKDGKLIKETIEKRTYKEPIYYPVPYYPPNDNKPYYFGPYYCYSSKYPNDNIKLC